MSDSSIYLYCLCRTKPTLPTDLRGLGGDTLRLINWKGVSAVVSAAPRSGYPATTENALLHERVVEEIQSQSPVIPMRFSSLLSEEALVTDLLRNNYESISDTLETLEGRIEVSLRLLLPIEKDSQTSMTEQGDSLPLGGVVENVQCSGPSTNAQAKVRPGESARPKHGGLSAFGTTCGYLMAENTRDRGDSSGAEYLLERQRFYNLKDGLLNGWTDKVVFLSQRLFPYWEQMRQESLPLETSILCLYFLLRKERLEGFLQGVGAIRKSHPELKLLFSGPWPPYNFIPKELIQKGVQA
jgi:hypothetical protein